MTMPEGRPIGVRMRPNGAFVLAGRLAQALAELGLLDELPPRLN